MPPVCYQRRTGALRWLLGGCSCGLAADEALTSLESLQSFIIHQPDGRHRHPFLMRRRLPKGAHPAGSAPLIVVLI